MGQYYVIANITKKEFIDPGIFDEGVKLLEFGSDGRGAMTALAVLLANSNGRGGGDLDLDEEQARESLARGVYPGHWAGDQIVIAGDYAEKTDPGEHFDEIIYNLCDESGSSFRDISQDAKWLICQDPYIAARYKE